MNAMDVEREQGTGLAEADVARFRAARRVTLIGLALNVLLTAQVTVHLFRIVLTWPLYLVEDFLIFLAAFHDTDDE